MTNVFIIGLPQTERSRVESELLKRRMKAHIIPAGWGRQGEYHLLPNPDHAIHILWDYCKTVGDGFGDAHIYVLPYARIPDDVDGELREMAKMGANIYRFQQETDGWPFLKRRQQFDQPTAGIVTKLLLAAIGGAAEEPIPSVYIASVMADCPQLIVVTNAIDRCDQVSQQRYPFIKDAMDSFAELIRLVGRTAGTLDEFFAGRQLNLAQSGGDSIELEVKVGGVTIHKMASNIHLKKGDVTNPHNCPRIYFQGMEHGGLYYVFLLYVGPHREGDFKRTHHLA